MGKYEELSAEREEVAYFMRRLYRQGLTTCSGGNLSRRVDGDLVLVTPSALDKGELTADQIALFTLSGENLTPQFKSSIETEMHLEVLRQRKDITAIVHAHPVTATAFTASNMQIDHSLTAEAYAVIGKPAIAKYKLMGTDELAKIVAGALKNANVALMQNHGIITVGKSMLQAFDRLEVTEATAKMTWITYSLKAAAPLTEEQKKEIDKYYG